MPRLSDKSLLAIAAVVDVAVHARGTPVAAKALAARHGLPPRRLEPVLQALVHAGVLKGVRGPRGGYELARERRRITAGEIVRAAMQANSDEALPPLPRSALVDAVVDPMMQQAMEAWLARLDAVTVADLCREAEERAATGEPMASTDFTI